MTASSSWWAATERASAAAAQQAQAPALAVTQGAVRPASRQRPRAPAAPPGVPALLFVLSGAIARLVSVVSSCPHVAW